MIVVVCGFGAKMRGWIGFSGFADKLTNKRVSGQNNTTIQLKRKKTDKKFWKLSKEKVGFFLKNGSKYQQRKTHTQKTPLKVFFGKP